MCYDGEKHMKTKYPYPLKSLQKFFRKNPALAIGGSFTILVVSLVLAGKSADPMQQRANAYSDVQPDSTSASAVEEMSRLGFLRGYENGLFGPDDAVTRGQAAILLKRLRDRDIKAIRAQVEEMRFALSLGTCGDATMQKGEECDDGNLLSTDGCSAECLTEVIHEFCADGHKIDEEFPAPDGCNTCICTRSGVICTTMQCAAPESEAEEVELESASIELPIIDLNTAPTCGNRICEPREDTLPPDRRFYCPQDCTGETYEPQCGRLKQEFSDLADTSRICQGDDDCVKLEQHCPFFTCGEAVNKMSYPTLSMKRDDMVEACRLEGENRECVSCANTAAFCQQGRCVLLGGSDD